MHQETSELAIAQETPGHREWERGLRAARAGRWMEAREIFRSAVDANPADTLFRLNLANACRHTHQHDEAIEHLRVVLASEPHNELALQALADCQVRAHDFEGAASTCEALEDLGCDSTLLRITYANALQSIESHGLAVEKLILAYGSEPHNPQIHSLLSHSFRKLGLQKESAQCIGWAREQESQETVATIAFHSFEKRHVFDWTGFGDDVRKITEGLEQMSTTAVVPTCSFGLISLPVDPALLKKAHAADGRSACVGVQPLQAMSRPARRSERVRLGFVSHDFRTHPVAQLTVELFERLDRDRFEVFLYSTSLSDGSALRARVEGSADRFIDISRASDRESAVTIQSDAVDVLFDLGGYTTGCRPPIFAYRPAPIQVSFLGFPGTTGADHFQYLIGDPYVTPIDCADLYSEKIAQMPTCFQPNGQWRPTPETMTRRQAELPEDAFVMCAFNHTYKITPESFNVWCDLLKKIPDSVLWLKEINAQLHDNVRKEAEARGIDRTRILFAKPVSYAEHFSRLAMADLFLDTWPYNAHTTASDSIWAGVPVVTLYQNGFASRVAASVLNAAGIPEMAQNNVDDYKNTVLALAEDRNLLGRYKKHLRDHRMSLALFDSSAYVRDFQKLILRMHGRHTNGLPPIHLISE